MIDIVIGKTADKLRPGTELLCVIPLALGAPTGFKAIGDRFIMETASGIPMIVPQRAVRE